MPWELDKTCYFPIYAHLELELMNMENEWKVDKYGKRYRETAPGHIEHEMTITLSGGVEIPVSQLDEYHRHQKEVEEKRRQAALE